MSYGSLSAQNGQGDSRYVIRRKRRSPEQIIIQLRVADGLLSAGQSIAQVCQKLGVCEQTYHRWRNE
jgi:transposase-like protein